MGSLSTGITNTNGIAEVTVTGVTGTVTFTCTYSNVSDTCTVQTETIIWQPLLDGTDSVSNWTGTGSWTVTDGVIKARKAKFDDYWDNTVDWELSFEMKNDYDSGIEIVESSQTSADRYCIQILEDQYGTFLNYMPLTSRTVTEVFSGSAHTDFVPMKLRKKNGTYYWYKGGVLAHSFTVSDTWSNVRIAFHSWTNSHYAYLKNIKVVEI